MKTKKSALIDKVIQENTNLSAEELKSFLASNHSIVLSVNAIKIRRTRLKPRTKVEKTYVEQRTEASNASKIRKEADQLIADNNRLRIELEASFKLRNNTDFKEFLYKPLSKDTESVAVVLASDWHVEEEVKSETVNGLNEYNLDVARRCAELFFQNTLKLVEKERHATKIDTLILALLGDFITGRLHEENIENALLQTADAMVFAEGLIVAGIEYLLKNSDLNLIIPCHSGNHARITKKVHFSNEQGLSVELIAYKHIAARFEGNPRVKILISRAYMSYIDVGGYTIAFQHGHGIAYGGAYGGITTSVIKRVRIWEQSRHADLYCFGHHHTQFDGGFFIANGSMIGYGARGLALAYAYEPRMQQFFLINLKHRRKTVVAPILLNP